MSGRLTIARTAPVFGSSATTAPSTPLERIGSRSLEVDVDRQMNVGPRHLLHLAKHPELTSERIDFDLSATVLATKRGFPLLLEPRLPDRIPHPISLEPPELPLADLADVAEKMSSEVTIEVTPARLDLERNPRELDLSRLDDAQGVPSDTLPEHHALERRAAASTPKSLLQLFRTFAEKAREPGESRARARERLPGR